VQDDRVSVANGADGALLRRAAVAAATLLAVGCIALAVVAALADADSVQLRLSPVWLVPGALALAAMQLAHIALWRSLLRSLRTPLAGRQARAIWSVSNLARYVPTGLLAPAARIAMSARQGVPRSATLAASGYELALSLLGAGVLSAWLLTREGAAVRWAAAALVLAILTALHPGAQARALGIVGRRLGRPVSLPPLAPLVSVRVTALYAASFAVGGLGLCAVVQGLYDLTASDLPTVIAVLAFGYVAGVIGFLLPGGIGVREAAMAGALSTVVPFAVGAAAAIVLRLLQLVVELVLAGAFSAAARRPS
jgi:uncharacterized membrane protein YbhN (UPF0104 family)